MAKKRKYSEHFDDDVIDSIKQPELYMFLQNEDENGVKNKHLVLNPHTGQLKVINSTARTILMLAGTQGGKTSLGPVWLYLEMLKHNKGIGDYMVVTVTYPLLTLKALPEIEKFFKIGLGVGRYKTAERKFIITNEEVKKFLPEIYNATPIAQKNDDLRIIFGHATNPESLESATAKAAWLDEAGQDGFKYDSYEAIKRRLTLYQGRILITSTPYNHGWLKKKIHDVGINDNSDDKSRIDVVSFPSWQNPIFPKQEAIDAKKRMPRWKYLMFYEAKFTRPKTAIYGNFDDENTITKLEENPEKINDFDFDDIVYVGLDFGGVNTAAVFYLRCLKNNCFVLYDVYKNTEQNVFIQKNLAEIKKRINKKSFNYVIYGGSGSEDEWRTQYKLNGLRVKKPKIQDFETGIDAVYDLHEQDKIIILQNAENTQRIDEYLEEKQTYKRIEDEFGNATKIIYNKTKYHLMDAERYVISSVKNIIDNHEYVKVETPNEKLSNKVKTGNVKSVNAEPQKSVKSLLNSVKIKSKIR